MVGRANVGKSTLVNALVEEKVSIVSPVAQTTRNCIRGIWTGERGQLVFLDTPGVHKAAHDLGRLMNRVARNSAEGADITVKRTVLRDGQVYLQDTFNTHYQPWQAAYEYGPGTEGYPPEEDNEED